MERLIGDLREYAEAQGWQTQDYSGEATYLTLAPREKVVMTWWWVPEAHMTGLVTMLSLPALQLQVDPIWQLWDAVPRPDWFRQHTLTMSLEGFENTSDAARVVIRLSVFSESVSRASLEHFEVATRWCVKVMDYIQRLADGEDIESLIGEAEAAFRVSSASSASILEVEQPTLPDADTLLHERLRPLLEEGQLDEAGVVCREYLALADESGDRYARMWPLEMSSFVLARQGALDEARALAEEVMVLALEVHDRHSTKMVPWLGSLCDVSRLQEDWESAVEYGQWRFDIVSGLGNEAAQSIIHAETYLGEALLKTDEVELAEAHLMQAQRMATEAGFTSPRDLETIERCLRQIQGDRLTEATTGRSLSGIKRRQFVERRPPLNDRTMDDGGESV